MASWGSEEDRAASAQHLKILLDMSQKLELEKELTPIMAWSYISKHERFTELTYTDFELLGEELVAKTRCFGWVIFNVPIVCSIISITPDSTAPLLECSLFLPSFQGKLDWHTIGTALGQLSNFSKFKTLWTGFSQWKPPNTNTNRFIPSYCLHLADSIGSALSRLYSSRVLVIWISSQGRFTGRIVGEEFILSSLKRNGERRQRRRRRRRTCSVEISPRSFSQSLLEATWSEMTQRNVIDVRVFIN